MTTQGPTLSDVWWARANDICDSGPTTSGTVRRGPSALRRDTQLSLLSIYSVSLALRAPRQAVATPRAGIAKRRRQLAPVWSPSSPQPLIRLPIIGASLRQPSGSLYLSSPSAPSDLTTAPRESRGRLMRVVFVTRVHQFRHHSKNHTVVSIAETEGRRESCLDLNDSDGRGHRVKIRPHPLGAAPPRGPR